MHRQPIAWHLVDVTVVEPVKGLFHVIRLGRKWWGVPVRALNLDDGRLTQSIFVDERDPASLTPDDVRWGPTQKEDLPVPPLTITKLKAEGKTPGCFVRDARGVRYLLKLDPVDAPELLSGAEVVTSKLLYALGYHVPSYEVVFLRKDDVQGPEGLDLHALFDPRMHKGVVRASSSQILEGEILGPVSFKRFRDCAELRALKLAYAWVNNIDAKDHNSLLVWDGQKTVGYLIDFGTSLGADAGLGGPKTPCEGWTYVVDLPQHSLQFLTLGFYRPTCDSQQQPVSSNVGLFTSHLDPKRWKPYAPNMAFKAMTDNDARWIAHRMARLSRAQIEAAVSAGRYSRPEDAAYLVEILDQRRLAIIAAYREEDEDE